MKVVLKDGRRYVLKLTWGEEVLQALKEFCVTEKVEAGTFQGLGACNYVKLSAYNLGTKKYNEKELKEDLEIVNLTGNICIVEGEPFIHMHGTFSNFDMQALGGHVHELKVSVTCEIFLIALDGKMERKLDENIGLKLLD